MKGAGRKTSGAYELYGFIPKVDNGKHSAICMTCNRVLQNTATVRLAKHRNSCLATRKSGGDHPQYPNIEIQKHNKIKPVSTAPQNEDNNFNIKEEQSNIQFDDANNNENAHDNTSYEDTTEATNPAKLPRRDSINEDSNDTSLALSKSTKPYETSPQEESPIQWPVTTQLQSPQPFESYNAPVITNTNKSALDTNDDIEDEDDEDLINMQEELDVIEHLMPRSKESKQLHDELSKAEAEYYRCKAAYFKKLTENSKIRRTLMLLESRKLQLEIERLTHES